MLTKAIGDAIRQRRESIGLSQEALAALSGLSRTYVGEVERGDVAATITTLDKLAKGLNWTLIALISTAVAN
jgi:transcriptional regulator with XRE-family HTH domain